MRKIALIVLSLVISGMALGQSVKVQSAREYLEDFRLKEAKKAITEALEHENTKKDPKTWYYKGRIYMTIYMVNSMDDAVKVGMPREKVRKALGKPDKNRRNRMEYKPEMTIYFDDDQKVKEFNKPANGAYENIAEDPLITAYDAFQKTFKLDENDEFSRRVKKQMLNLRNLTYNEAVNKYNNKNYEGSINYFMKTVDIKKTFGQVDTNSIFNAALAAANAKMYDKALNFYKDLIEYRFSEPEVYTSASKILLNKEDTAKAENILKLGRKRFPDNYNILIILTNIYLTRGNVEKSTELLNKAIEKQPDNEELYYNIGVIYDQSSKDSTLSREKREELLSLSIDNYKKAIKLKEGYFDAYYNLGALYFNKGVQIVNSTDTIPIEKKQLYEKMKKKANEYFEKALPYLEKAKKLKPKDRNTLKALKELYARTKRYEKLKKIKAKISQGKDKKESTEQKEKRKQKESIEEKEKQKQEE